MKHTCISITSFIFSVSVLSIALPIHADDSWPQPLHDTVPDTWQLDAEYLQTTPDRDKWWKGFADPSLDRLIASAVANNYDVLAAQHRIEAARQMSRADKAGYYPTIGVSAGWSREGTSADMQRFKAHSETMSYFNLGLTMNWEIDVFGRIQSRLKADKANLRVTEAEYDATLVSLCSNVAKAYFQLRMSQAEQSVAESNINVAEKLQNLAQTRYEVGLVPGVDPVQARMALTRTRSSLPAIKADITTAVNRIALLTGEHPDKLQYLLSPEPLPEPPAMVCAGSPESLLRRRPDIVEAESRLAYYAAQAGISKKDFLPTLSVSAGIGTEAHNLKDLFGSGSLYYQVMPTLSWTVFDGMARNARTAEAKANLMSQIDTYNMTVMTAMQEVNNAMAQWQAAGEQLIYSRMLLKDARRELELQTDRYKQGLCDFSDVADAQTSVLQYENQTIESQASQLASLVAIYTALGGGWE